MNWDAIGAIGEILGALGVLVTLVYLATQIRENTRSLQAVSLQSVLALIESASLTPYNGPAFSGQQQR